MDYLFSIDITYPSKYGHAFLLNDFNGESIILCEQNDINRFGEIDNTYDSEIIWNCIVELKEKKVVFFYWPLFLLFVLIVFSREIATVSVFCLKTSVC